MKANLKYLKETDDNMYLITGLGNPTKKYEHTRHNAGFESIDVLGSLFSIRLGKNECKALTGQGFIGNEKVILAKPQTFMNLSGEAVQALMHFYKIDAAHLIVIYDDTDLDVGKLRIRKSGSAGGHNGMKDIIKMTGTQDFARIRVGIGKRPDYMDMVDFVLGCPSGNDKKLMAEAFEKAARAAEDIIVNGIDHAMNHYNS